jgi:hypothetical protein
VSVAGNAPARGRSPLVMRAGATTTRSRPV